MTTIKLDVQLCYQPPSLERRGQGGGWRWYSGCGAIGIQNNKKGRPPSLKD